jgi:hypothetical protein
MELSLKRNSYRKIQILKETTTKLNYFNWEKTM